MLMIIFFLLSSFFPPFLVFQYSFCLFYYVLFYILPNNSSFPSFPPHFLNSSLLTDSLKSIINSIILLKFTIFFFSNQFTLPWMELFSLYFIFTKKDESFILSLCLFFPFIKFISFIFFLIILYIS